VPDAADRRPAVPDGVRLSDDERERAVGRLRQAAGDGVLSLDEVADRMADVYRAATVGELAVVVQDLPAPRTPKPRATKRIVGVLSGAKQHGRWRPAAQVEALASFGSCRIDLADAVIDGPEVQIRATALFGSIEVLVPDDVHVELGGFAVLGSKSYKVRASTPPPGAPTIYVDARALVGKVAVRTKAFQGRRA
jgi:hypothetical protein